jgi:hypothetical protein
MHSLREKMNARVVFQSFDLNKPIDKGVFVLTGDDHL